MVTNVKAKPACPMEYEVYSLGGETQYWIEVILEIKWLSREEANTDYEECSELLAIFTSIGKEKNTKRKL